MYALASRPAFGAARTARLGASRARLSLVVSANKGFSADKPKSEDKAEATTSTAGKDADALDALEARIRSRRNKKVEAKVDVKSDVVDEVTGRRAQSPAAKLEEQYIAFLTFLFGAVIIEGLLIAGSGFLPEDWDQFIASELYPNYSGTVLVFLAASSLYGLYKTGKLPGMTQSNN